MFSLCARPNSRAIACCVLFVMAGCATSPPKPKFDHVISQHVRFAKSDMVEIVVATKDRVEIADFEKQRFAETIKTKIAEKQATSAEERLPLAYSVEVTLTRYDKGSALARAFLAGLGQIHVDGEIRVFSAPAHVALEEFTLEKTFAWGGIYGSSTSIEDIEKTFAEGVANALTDQEDGARAKQGTTR
jgi:hypothetical protein